MLLVVEDYADFATALTRHLEKAEIALQVAPSATEARARFVGQGPSAWSGLVVDPGLPEGLHAGVEFLRWTRPYAPGLPAVCVSGQLSVELITSVNKLGVQFVTKTETVEQLPWFLERTRRYERTRPEAIAARAAAEYGLTEAEGRFVDWFLRGGSVADYLVSARVTRSAYDKHRRSVLEKTGDADHVSLVVRLWRRALDENLG